MNKNNEKVKAEFFQWGRGLIFGIAMGIVMTKAYQQGFGETMYESSKVVQVVRDTNTLSCHYGSAKMAERILNNVESDIDCKSIGEKWAEIYKESK